MTKVFTLTLLKLKFTNHKQQKLSNGLYVETGKPIVPKFELGITEIQTSAKLKTDISLLTSFNLLGHLKPTYKYILSCYQLNDHLLNLNEFNYTKLGKVIVKEAKRAADISLPCDAEDPRRVKRRVNERTKLFPTNNLTWEDTKIP